MRIARGADLRVALGIDHLQVVQIAGIFNVLSYRKAHRRSVSFRVLSRRRPGSGPLAPSAATAASELKTQAKRGCGSRPEAGPDRACPGAWADVIATGGRCKPPGEADGKRHLRPGFSPPLAAGRLRERSVNHGDETNTILMKGDQSNILLSINIGLLMWRCPVSYVSNVDKIYK